MEQYISIRQHDLQVQRRGHPYQEGGNGVEHIYYLSGSQITAEQWGSNLCVYLYDADGAPIGMQYRTESMSAGKFYTFWFERNLQGDIIAVYNEGGTKVCTYTYDAWGNVTLTWVNSLATNLYAVYNPFKYRGYYHDTETGFYYLQSRYYDPAIGRFINADFVGYLGIAGNITGFNLFSYCGNNSVMGYDPQGEWDWGKFINGASLLAIGVIACAAAITVVSGGACAPLLVAATATFVAGGMTVINGASEIVESFTDYNPVRDSLYNGDTEFYETQRDVFATAAEVGTILLTLGSGMMCFVEGTQITTSTGMVNIEDINIGTLVLSSDSYTMNTDYKAVIEVYKSEAYDLATIYINGEEVTTTLNHPFWTEEYGWVGAEYLTPDCTLVLSSGETAHIDHIVIQHYNSPVYVYNFEVEEFHTYYVGNSGVLVHNKNAWDPEVSETIQKLLEGTGQLRNLRNNPNFHGVNIEYLLQRTPAELEQLAKSGIISSKTLKQIKKAFEGRDLGTKGRKC